MWLWFQEPFISFGGTKTDPETNDQKEAENTAGFPQPKRYVQRNPKEKLQQIV
jgi:hypothetical protein